MFLRIAAQSSVRVSLAILGMSLVLGAMMSHASEGDRGNFPTEPDKRPSRGDVNRIMGIGEARKPAPFTREQRFLHAVRQGDRVSVERALELGVNVHSADDLNRSALLLSVHSAESLDLLRFLRARGAEIDTADLGGRTALSYAAGRGRIDLLEFLLGEGAKVDRADAVQRTPLFYAAIGDHAEVVSLLHARGADLDARARYGQTPLISACEKDAGRAAKRLLELGADATLVDRKGRSAHDRAVRGTPECLVSRAVP